MKGFLAPGILLAVVLPAVTALRAESEAYRDEVGRARAERVAQLTKPDNWLTLVGLHYLKVGENTVGATRNNDVVLAGGPARLGTVSVAADGRLYLTIALEVDAQIDGKSLRSAELRSEEMGKSTLVTFGTMSFFALERGGKKALRVKDSAAKTRTHFIGLDYFPIDPSWRIEAQWVPFEKSRQIPITNILGQADRALAPGKAVFQREGKTIELLVIDEGPNDPLFIVISDATSGHETYEAARFIYTARPKGNKIMLDFNLAENPPCAFTSFSTCPLPPAQNRLPFPVKAGEKKYRGKHE